jgi:electron transfer flavoprotein alpha subunit
VIAVVPLRDGRLPAGAEEAVAEAGGRGLLVEAGGFRPGALAAALAPLVAEEAVVILPASPDGRDLAPRLAVALGRPLLGPAVEIGERGATLLRLGGAACEEVTVDGPFVATLLPGVRGVDPAESLPGRTETVSLADEAAGPEPELVRLLEPDPDTVDLVEAPRIVGAGAGLGDPSVVPLLAAVARALGASVGATRVVTDAGWLPPERQIGTTGVAVNPRLYVALGISGAVQHTTGLGAPDHIVAVNLDPSCPMMAMADLGIVTDAAAFLSEVAQRLGVEVHA